MSLLEVSGLSQMYGDKVLYREASFDLHKGEHMGVVGLNGAGKSTLIGILTAEVIPDEGSVRWQPGIKVGYLDQYAAQADGNRSIWDYLTTAYAQLYDLEREVNSLYEQYAQTGVEELLERAADAQSRLEHQDFYILDSKIDRVVTGLGLQAIGTDRPLCELSGGQRAKVILAKLLLEEPEVLLLDEPTNFLDKEHVDWLAEFLSSFPSAFVVVSHDFAFLQRICTCIADVEGQTIKKYHGTYEHFLRQKEHLREDHIRQYAAQQEKIKREEEFIRRNIAGVNTKIAQGRRKRLERMERIAPPTFVGGKPNIHFDALPMSVQEVLKVRELVVGYQYALLPKLGFTVRGEQKLVITGFNGIGKSTLLKTLVGEIPALGGSFQFADPVKIGYYEQELHWQDPTRTPMQILNDRYPSLTVKEARKRLSQCGVRQDHAIQEVGTLSGGEQSKVKLCLLTLAPCNFLILDEPTNHLDNDSKQALQEALIAFPGNVILVSHEESFYRDWADRVLRIEELL